MKYQTEVTYLCLYLSQLSRILVPEGDVDIKVSVDYQPNIILWSLLSGLYGAPIIHHTCLDRGKECVGPVECGE